MKMYFVEKFSEGDADAQVEAMRKYFTLTELKEADVIYCGSVEKMNIAISAHRSTGKPIVNYCWDYYLWAHKGKHSGFNWVQYAEFMKQCTLVIVPSHAQQLRLKELLGIDSVVVRTGIKVYDDPVTDAGFILDPLRYYPEENRDWAEKAAAILNIPIVHSEHGYTHEEFRKLVASCTFMTSCVREASTGALTLIEGLYLGKPSLVSNSPYQGAKDYVGDLGYYFQYDNFDDLVAQMRLLWENKPRIERRKAKKYVRDNFSYDLMAKNLYDTISAHCHI